MSNTITFQPSNILTMLTTLPSLPDDILYIIKKDLDFTSTMALRSACRQLYSVFPDPLLLSEMILLETISQQQFIKLFAYLVSVNKTQYIRKLVFNQTQITEQEIISVLEHSKNLQELYILACNQIKLLPITNTLVKWHQDGSGNSPDLKELKKIIMTRCVGGKRHSLIIKKVIEDLHKLKFEKSSQFEIIKSDKTDKTDQTDQSGVNNNSSISIKISKILNSNVYNNKLSTKPFKGSNGEEEKEEDRDGIFQFQNCQINTCEYCTMSCESCKVKYKYWDEFWMKCGWCKERNFCGKCIMDASKRNKFKNYAFQFMRIKLCHMFDLSCPF